MDNQSAISTNRLNLDDLPDDIYLFYLFDYLNLDDVLKLKLVSKKLYSIVRSYDITELFFLNNDTNQCFCKYVDDWFSTTKSTKVRNQFDRFKLPLFKSPPINLINLKHLKIFDLEILSFVQLVDLNKFTKLQILEIGGFENFLTFSTLNLPNLKVLSIKFFSHKRSKLRDGIQIDARNLHTLHMYQCDDYEYTMDQLIRVKHFLSIRNLKLRWFEKSALMFSNLECLELLTDKWLKSPILLKLRNLKKLRIIKSERVKELKDLFITCKKSLQIVLQGVRIKEISKLDEYNKRANDLAFQLDNYNELEDDLNFVIQINYNNLMHLLSNNLPPDLFKKYTNIQLITITDHVADEDQLIQFIKECSSLCNLEIRRSSLSQDFFDRLPMVSSLYNLLVYQNTVALDFKFITKISYLVHFYTDQRVVVDKNLKNLKFLKEIRFMNNNKELVIEKTRYGRECRYLFKPSRELEIFKELYQERIEKACLYMAHFLRLDDLIKRF